jgi:hypothetical protein
MTSQGLLFDSSPLEDETPRKQSRKRKNSEEPVVVAPRHDDGVAAPVYGFLASIEGHYKCDKCGLDRLDLVSTRRVDGDEKWLVCCGWWCMHCWLVDPIPGLIDEEDRKHQQQKKDFRVRGGLFDGQTFDEIAAAGKRWYIESVVKKSERPTLAAAAAEWLSKNP